MKTLPKSVALPLLPLALLAACSGDGTPIEVLEPSPPGLSSEPRWLTFTCVEPGCQDALVARVEVLGDRDVAVKRIVLSDPDRTDFAFESSQTPPFILSPRDTFDVTATYTPTGDPRLGDVDLVVTFTDADAEQSDPDRIRPGELVIPLVRRLVGEPVLAADPTDLFFGAVPLGTDKALSLTLRNEGFGNVGLVLDSVTTDFAEEIRVENLPTEAILPGETWDLRVVYQPVTERFIQGLVTVTPVGALETPLEVPFVGTSVGRPKIEITPNDGIDFGDIAVGGTVFSTVTLRNGGADDLEVRSIRFDPEPSLLTTTLTGVDDLSTVGPLQTVTIGMSLLARLRGPVSTNLLIETNDPVDGNLRLPITALVTEPEIRVSPTSIDFGTVPRGWTIVRPIEIRNQGYGDLVLDRIDFVLGSSELFTFRELPNFPVVLQHRQRLGLEIEFRAEAEASFSATLAIESNDEAAASSEVTLRAAGASCDLGCPIANGQPSCTGGVCAIAECNDGWYNADGSTSNGCECREIDQDPGAFCADSRYLGRLNDDGSSVTFRGIVPETNDRDVLRVFAYDGSEFFDDDFDVRINLDSADPGLRMCVYRHQTDVHLSECFFENESCPSDGQFRRDGSFGSDDSADFIIRVFRDPNSAPTCAPYTVFVRNG